VVRSYLAAFAAADPDTIASHVTEDFLNQHTSALGDPCEGRDEYRRRLPGFLARLPGVRYDVEDVVADGTRVVAAYVISGTAEGVPFSLRGTMWFEVRDGLIARRTDYWDSLGFLRQTGQA
jgi:steroid delta-isomerase-like uncharacterized protein